MSDTFFSDRCRCRLHLYPCPKPPCSATKSPIIPTRHPRARSPAHCSLCRPWFHSHSFVTLFLLFKDACSCQHLLDGLSIPFFSVGRRTLTFSRSLVGDQPEWLNWVRREPPQDDAERIVAASVRETEREGQNHVDWPHLPDLSDPIPEGAKTPRKVLKFQEVCIALCPWPHLTFLIRST